MTKHLVSLLRKAEQLALRDELLARLEITESVLREFANRRGLSYDSLPPHFVSSVTDACLSGMGFAPEEVRGVPRTTPRSRIGRDDAE